MRVLMNLSPEEYNWVRTIYFTLSERHGRNFFYSLILALYNQAMFKEKLRSIEVILKVQR